MTARIRPAAAITPPRASRLGCVALVAVLTVVGLAMSPTASAARQAPGQSVTCRGPSSLGDFFRLTDRRRIVGKRTNCAMARKVVRRFPRSCSAAYAAQGRCRVRASGRWRCRSRIVGSLANGAPSKQKCKHRRSKLRFEVAYFPTPEPRRFTGPSLFRDAYDRRRRCVDTSEPGTVIPPPDLVVGSWEIHVMRRVGDRVGELLQRALVAQRVARTLHAGLGSQPRNYPNRIPIFITRRLDEWDGVFDVTCEDESLDGIVVITQPRAAALATTAAHELFHAYSFGLNPAPINPWWEEASATWSSGKVGLEDTTFDIALQYPKPLDSKRPPIYPYAMSRFVQFLDSRGLIGDPDWALQRQVISGYEDPGATPALAAAIGRTSTLGAELAAFWGDRLRQNPVGGPQLRPTAANARRIQVRPGTSDVAARANRLDTDLIDFGLAANVKRVEFEFDPPAANGFFWGLVSADESRPFPGGDSVSFCVGGGDEDDLEWPGRFPVTFTNGAMGSGRITGAITIRAQTSADQCTNPILNRACQLLDRAGVREIVGQPGTFDALSDDPRFGDGSHLWQCFYAMDPFTSPGRDALLTVVRYRRARAARRAVRNLIEAAGYRPIDIGHAAAIFTDSSNAVVAVAVGREFSAVQVDNEVGRRGAIALARRIAR